MRIKSLRAFCCTFAEGSLAAAASRLNISQPAVSRMISGLEEDLDLILFDRTSRSLAATSEGIAFYREAKFLLQKFDQVPQIADEIREGRTNNLRVVSNPRIASALVSPAIAAYLSENSNINVSLDVRARREASKWLAGLSYDIGVGSLPVNHPEIQTKVLLQARAQTLVPSGHPYANYTELSAADLVNEPIIGLSSGLLLREQLDDVFKQHGTMPRYICDVSASAVACNLVADGVGLTIADELVASQVPAEKVQLVPLVPEKWMSFGLLLPKKYHATPRNCDEFIAKLENRAKELASKSKTIRLP